MAGGKISASYGFSGTGAPTPLRQGNYRAAIGHNIKQLDREGTAAKGTKQNIAIALSTAKGSSTTGRGPGSRSLARVAYMKGLSGVKYNPIAKNTLRRAAYNAGQAARAGARGRFHYPGVAPFGPGMAPYGKGKRPTPAKTALERKGAYDGRYGVVRDAKGQFASAAG